MILWLTACTTQLHVMTSTPEAEIGVLRAVSQPSREEPPAEIRGTGELRARISYSVFDTWWVWTRVPGGEVNLQPYPTELAVGPTISCVSGVLLLIPLIGCFWVSKPVSDTLYVEVLGPADAEVPMPVPPAPVPPSTPGCAKDVDCKGDRICEAGVCVAP